MLKERKNKIFNKHFMGMISVFVIVIVTVLTFVSFMEDALKHNKERIKEGEVLGR